MPKQATSQRTGPADPIAPLDQARRRVNQLSGEGERGRLAVRFAKEAAAESVERTVDRALMSGDPAQLAQLEGNRERLAQLRSANKRASRDDTEDTLHRLTDARATPGHMAAWLYGATLAQPPIRAVRVAERLRETMPKETWATLRQATADRVMQARGEGVPPQQSADDFMKFMHGRGERLMTTMFSKNERELMGRIGNTVRLQGEAAQAAVQPLAARLQALLTA
jgi:hypothetical protein